MRQMYGRVNQLSAARGGVCISGMEVQMDLLDVVDMEIYIYIVPYMCRWIQHVPQKEQTVFWKNNLFVKTVHGKQKIIC